jgi:hypothetical protein
VRAVRILSVLTQRPALAQEIPVAIELHADRFKPRLRRKIQVHTIPQLVLFLDQALDGFEDAFVCFLICHAIPLSAAHERHVDHMLREKPGLLLVLPDDFAHQQIVRAVVTPIGRTTRHRARLLNHDLMGVQEP